ncbi:MAG: ABC transporter permease [Cyanobacteria bacterium P01_F01_bin.86]
MTYNQYWSLVLTKVHLNLKSEVSKSYLSYIWWVLEPALFVLVFYIVFETFLNRGGEDFVVFLVCGKIPFLWFSRTVQNASNSIVAGRGLMNQIAIPKSFFPVVVCMQDSFKSLFVFLVMLAFLLFSGVQPTMSWLALPVIMVVQFTFNLSVALFGAAIVPFIPDFRYMISTGLMLMMFGSGIFYSYKDVLLPEHQEMFLLNPMANLIRIYRDMLLGYNPIDWLSVGYIFSVCLVAVAAMLWFIRKFDNYYPRLVLQ